MRTSKAVKAREELFVDYGRTYWTAGDLESEMITAIQNSSALGKLQSLTINGVCIVGEPTPLFEGTCYRCEAVGHRSNICTAMPQTCSACLKVGHHSSRCRGGLPPTRLNTAASASNSREVIHIE
jgi:hypothetical protein